MLAKGVKVSAGTDATRVASYNPWVSLAWLVTGKTVGGLRITPQRNCLDRETALRMWTENVTWFSNEEGKKGRIEVGQLADLIVPDRDYFACAEDEIADTTSELTIVGGKVVYGAGDFSGPRRQRAAARDARLVAGADLRRLRRLGRATQAGAGSFACKPRISAAAPTAARSTATITPPPGRPSCRSPTSRASGARSAAPAGRFDRRAFQETQRRLKFLRDEESANIPGPHAVKQKRLPMRQMRMLEIAAILAAAVTVIPAAAGRPLDKTEQFGVGAQYGTAHVYVAAADMDRFTASFLATFGGKSSQPSAVTVTPTPSTTNWQALATPVGLVSLFGFTTPIPYPFGQERTGYLVTDMDAAVRAARKAGAAVVVTPFPDAIGSDVVVQWPGGINMQFYWHTKAPSAPALQTVPENRVYVAPEAAASFIRSFVSFAHGKIVSDNAQAPGAEIGRPSDTYRRVRIKSTFGKITVLVTDGHLPFPYGRETMGYEVADVAGTLTKAKASGASVLVELVQGGRA